MFVVCVDFVFGIICSLQYCMNINMVDVDHTKILYIKKALEYHRTKNVVCKGEQITRVA